MSGRFRTLAGMTLVELLCVIGILALLAGILFPVLSAAKGKAASTTCLENLRSLGQAVQLYQSDHDGLIPSDNPRQGFRFTAGRKLVDPDPLTPYVKTVAVYHCRARRARETRSANLSDYIIRFVWDFSSLNGNRSAPYRLDPEASSVIAWDSNHLVNPNDIFDSSMRWIALRSDTSAFTLSPSSLKKSYLTRDGWQDNPVAGSSYYELRFPGEAWPPRLTALP